MRKRGSYQRVITVSDGTEDEHDVPKLNAETDTDTDIKTKKHREQTFHEYLWTRTLSKGPFIYFVVGIVLSIGLSVYYIMDNDTTFIIAGFVGLSVSLFGLKHFYTLISLKETVDRFHQLNMQFHIEHNELSKELDRITAAHINLRETQNRLKTANAKNRENLDNFREIQNNLDTLGTESIEELTELQEKSDGIVKKWRDSIYNHERLLLHTLFERLEDQGTRHGMNADEFKEFTETLPDEYKARFDRLGTFHTLCTSDSLLRYDDFRACLDLFAEMKVDNVDIEFEIRKTKKKKVPKRMASAGDQTQTKVKTIDLTKGHSSIELKDIEYDEEDSSDAPFLYEFERSIVITKRTIRGGGIKKDLMSGLFLSDRTDPDSDEEKEDDLFGVDIENSDVLKPMKPTEKYHFDVRDEKIRMKTLGIRKFTSLLGHIGD